jgi:hypothetical protein
MHAPKASEREHGIDMRHKKTPRARKPYRSAVIATAKTQRLERFLREMRAKIRPLCTTSQTELYNVYCFIRGIQIGLKLGALGDDDSLGTTVAAARMVRNAINSLNTIEEASGLAPWE